MDAQKSNTDMGVRCSIDAAVCKFRNDLDKINKDELKEEIYFGRI